jgi:hypothetical protein
VILGQLSINGGHEVHHVRVPLERHVLRHLHGAELTDTSKIVPPEIDEHDVFGTFLFISLEFFGQPKILLFVLAARTGAGYGMRFDATSFGADEHLRR